MILFYVMLRVVIILSSSFAQPAIVYFYPEINNRPKNCPEKESDVRLICKTANGTASRMIIKRAHDQKLLYISPGASTSAEFLIVTVGCVDMGVYQCIIDDIHMETTTLVLPECPPLPCHQEGTAMSVYADVNKPLDISLCVLVYRGILNYTRINNVSVRRQAAAYYEWTWDYYKNKQTSACFRNLTIELKHKDWTTEGYGGMSVRVYSWAGDPFYLDYNISVIPPASPLEIEEDETKGNNKVLDEKETQEDKEALEDIEALEKPVIIMSPFLIIISGAIVMIVVMIIRKGSRHVVEENVVEEHVLEELPEAQAPENPLYEEIIHFRSDMPDKPVHYVNLKTNTHDEEVKYEKQLCQWSLECTFT